MRTVVWFRGKDLRLSDHAPLRLAAEGEAIPVFVVEPALLDPREVRLRAHRTQFLLDSLEALERGLRERGSGLVVLGGDPVVELPRLASLLGADRVVAQRRVEPRARAQDDRLRAVLGDRYVTTGGETLFAPGAIRTGAGKPYSVFTPFARACRERAAEIGAPEPAPRRLSPLPRAARGDPSLLSRVAGHLGPRDSRVQHGGEPEAEARLKRFLRSRAAGYASARDRMDLDGTSRLSADLTLGLLSVRTVWSTVAATLADRATALASYSGELLWREFAHGLLWDRPSLLREPFRREFASFPWQDDPGAFAAWVEGRTGYPVVDAASRQLLAEGFVHNRARMIAASFLTKHLLVDFRRGERHYAEQLTDADVAVNDAGWQWSAGCGADAQPWFRVFNPMLQGARFDPEGDYVRRWVPELAGLPARWIHRPFDATPAVLARAGVVLGRDYPEPVVDHAEARARFLALASTLSAPRADPGQGLIVPA